MRHDATGDVRQSPCRRFGTVGLPDTVSASHFFSVSGDSLAFGDEDAIAELAVGEDTAIGVTWTSGGAPVTGRPLRFDVNGNPVKGRDVVFGSEDLQGGQLNPAFATTGSSFVTTLLLPASEARNTESAPANHTSPYGVLPHPNADCDG